MLTILQPYNKVDAQQYLSVAADMLLPQPFDDLPSDQESKRIATAILAEARKQLRIKSENLNEESRTKIMQVLNIEIDRYALSTGAGDLIKDRIGNKGALSSTQYNIQFDKVFPIRGRLRGVSRDAVMDTITSANMVTHLSPPEDFPSGQRISVFYKHQHVGDTTNQTGLIVVALRRGANLTVNAAWLVPFAFVDVSSASTSVDVLETFANRYGAPSIDADIAGQKLIIYRRISIGSEEEALKFQAFDPTVEGQTEIVVSGYFRQIDKDTQDVSLLVIVKVNIFKQDIENVGLPWE